MQIASKIFGLAIVLLLAGCAQIGRVQGGPKDTKPPVFQGSEPSILSTSVPLDTKEIRIYFDEYITLKDAFQQIVTSPPIEPSPIIEPLGTPKKYIRIRFLEDLAPNTTYNFNFGQALQDNNEGNPLPFFSYVFSTGEAIDSLSITGSVRHLTEKKLPENILVALYKIDTAYTDSVVFQKKPYYLSKVDSANQFNLSYLAEGKYRLVTFNEATPNLTYDPKNEDFGFYSEPIELKDSAQIQLKLFKGIPPYKVLSPTQDGFGKIIVEFEGKPDSLKIKPLQPQLSTMRVVHRPRSDTAEVWFNPEKETFEEKNPRLQFLVNHKENMDTITVIYDTKTEGKLKLEKSNTSMVPGKKLGLVANHLITQVNPDSIAIFKDSISYPVNYSITDSINPRKLLLDFPVEFEKAYEVILLPGAVKDYFGNTNDSLSLNVRTPRENELGNLELVLENSPKKPFFLKLYDSSDKLIEFKRAKAGTSTFEFRYLKPGNYYFKLLVDENQNGVWDTGDFLKNRQPEPAYLYPALIEIRAFWDLSETWKLPKPNQ